ncbi:MAG: hypothetical protein HQL67_01665 [Magnetococcales bacterium]|nr:hypothetical protein [Magnetococcales bacterium]
MELNRESDRLDFFEKGMEMSCNPELVSAFIDGELESVIVGAVTNHLLQCDDCCRVMGHLAMIQGAVAGNFALCDPETLTQSVMLAINNEKMTPARRRLSKRLIRFGVPALMVSTLLASPGLTAEPDDCSDSSQEIVHLFDERGLERS